MTKNKIKKKQPKPIKVKLTKPVKDFDEMMQRIVRVKPPQSDPNDSPPQEID